MREALTLMETELSRAIDAPSLAATLPCDDDGAVRNSTPEARPFPAGSTMARILADGKLRVGITRSLTLFGELDPLSGRVSGFDVDLGREIARELGLREDQVEFVDTLIEDRVPHLQDGTLDMVVLAMTITPERASLVEFSRPYYVAGQSLLVSRTNRQISGLRDLAGARVCTATGSTAVAELTRRAPAAELVLLRSLPECVTSLKAGAVDAVATDDVILAGFASDDSDLILAGGRFTTEPYGVAVPRGQADLADFVDGVIGRMLDDGRWGRLYYEYLGDIPGLPRVAEAKQLLASVSAD
jgi:ABC-type amino acid transport substrate-binding protein